MWLEGATGTVRNPIMKALTSAVVVLSVLLTLDVAMRLSPREATAQQPELRVEPEPPVRVIQIASTGGGVFYRLWTDGTIERMYWAGNPECAAAGFCGWEFVPDDVPPQPGARIIHIAAQFVPGTRTHSLLRLWSNGVIERQKDSTGGTCNTPEWCGWQVVPDVPAP